MRMDRCEMDVHVHVRVHVHVHLTRMCVLVPSDWQWTSDWTIERIKEGDADGWM